MPSVSSAGNGSSLYPTEGSADIDRWLELADGVDAAAAAWLPPTCHAASPEARAEAQAAVEAALGKLQAALSGGGPYLTGGAVSLADVAVLAALAGLAQAVLGRRVQAAFPAVTSWLQATAAQPHFAAVLGERPRWGWAAWAGPAPVCMGGRADRARRRQHRG